jgi:branched-chain amino acid transport system permease protein
MLGSMLALRLPASASSRDGHATAVGLIARPAHHDGLTASVSIERVAYRPLRNAPKLAPLISAIGMSFILQNVGLLWKGPPIGFDVIPNTNVLTTCLGLEHELATLQAVLRAS